MVCYQQLVVDDWQLMISDWQLAIILLSLAYYLLVNHLMILFLYYVKFLYRLWIPRLLLHHSNVDHMTSIIMVFHSNIFNPLIWSSVSKFQIIYYSSIWFSFTWLDFPSVTTKKSRSRDRFSPIISKNDQKILQKKFFILFFLNNIYHR